jgi:hypothetical protein
VTTRRLITVSLLTGDCAAFGVGVRARESIATGVGALFGRRRSTVARTAEALVWDRIAFFGSFGATMGLDT